MGGMIRRAVILGCMSVLLAPRGASAITVDQVVALAKSGVTDTVILALIDRDPALARTMVVRLADLMHAVFDRADQPTAPLERELDLVRAYLDVERIRLGDRLTVRFEIAVFTYPGKAMKGTIPLKLTMPDVATVDKDQENDLIKQAAESAFQKFADNADRFAE